jgi:hypothetical protein
MMRHASISKRVRVQHHGPLGYPGARVGWEDLWLRLHVARRPVRLAPTLSSRSELRSQLALSKSCLKGCDSSLRATFEAEVAMYEASLTAVDRDGVVVDQHPGRYPYRREFRLSDIYTAVDWIDLAEAERMLDAYLATIGIRHATYKWPQAGRGLLVLPTTLDADAIEAHAAARESETENTRSGT